MDFSLISKLLALFVVTQALGLAVGIDLIQKINAGEIEQPHIVTENPGDIENALGLFGYIIFFTIIILLAIRFIWREWFFRVLEALAVFASAFLVFSVFVPEAAAMLAALLVLLRVVLKESLWLRNIAGIIAVAGAGALVGVSLGFLPVLVFIALLAVYDVIAVFGTKHMVVMAKALAKSNLAFTYALPTKKHQFELGAGDMVIPLAFSVSVLREGFSIGFPNYLLVPVLVLLGSAIGLIATLEYSSRNVGKALPALPAQTALMILMLAVSRALGF